MRNKENKVYSLYNNKEQEKLLAMAYSEEQIHEESKFYSEGVWFEADYVDNKFIENEKIYKKKIEFPVEPISRNGYIEVIQSFNWVS